MLICRHYKHSRKIHCFEDGFTHWHLGSSNGIICSCTVTSPLHSSWTVTFLSQSKVPLWCCYSSTSPILTLSWSKPGTMIHHLETSQPNILLGSYWSSLYHLMPSVVTYQQQPDSLCEAERSCRCFRGSAELNYGDLTKGVKLLLRTTAGACWQCTKWQLNSVVSINPGCQESVLPSASISILQKCHSPCAYVELHTVNVSEPRGCERPLVSHRFSKTPVQPGIWSSHCPVKGTERPAQACYYLSVPASPRQPSLGPGQQASESTQMHMHAHTPDRVMEHHAVVMTWIPLGWTVSAKRKSASFACSREWILRYADVRWYDCAWVQSVHSSAVIRPFVLSPLQRAHRCTEPLSQSVLYSTFLLPVASSIELLMPPHGHNRGIMGAVCLSWGGKLLIPGVWKACVGWISANKHSTQRSTQMYTHTSTCTHTTNTHTHKVLIFVSFRSISPSNSVPLWHVRSHNGLWHQPSIDHNVV